MTMAVSSPAAPAAAAPCAAAAPAPLLAAVAALLLPALPVAAAAPFFTRVKQPSMAPPGPAASPAAAATAGVMSAQPRAAPVLPLARVMLGWMDSGEPAGIAGGTTNGRCISMLKQPLLLLWDTAAA
jgi:hypothetical protein